jgi:hypothetical protein
MCGIDESRMPTTGYKPGGRPQPYFAIHLSGGVLLESKLAARIGAGIGLAMRPVRVRESVG